MNTTAQKVHRVNAGNDDVEVYAHLPVEICGELSLKRVWLLVQKDLDA